MNPRFRPLRRAGIAASALAAFALMFCEPGQSLDPVQPPQKPVVTPSDSTQVPVLQHNAGDNLKPGDTAAVTVLVQDSALSTMPVRNAVVVLSSTSFKLFGAGSSTGVSRLTDTTNENGEVEFRFTGSASGTGSISVTVTTVAGIRRTSTITVEVDSQAVVESRAKQLYFNAVRPTLKADGSDSTELRIRVIDENNNPVSGELIRFTANGGVVTASDITDDGGKAVAYLVSERINKKVRVTATLVSRGITATQDVTFSGITLTVSSQQRILAAGMIDSVLLELRDANDVPISGEEVRISASGSEGGLGRSGSDTLRIMTDTRGQIRTFVTSDVEKTITIMATALGALGSDTVTYTSKKLSISRSAEEIVGDSLSTVTLTADLKDGSNSAISGATLTWNTTFGFFTSKPFTTTNGQGQSSITLRSTKGTGLAVVSVEAKSGNSLIASATTTVRIRARDVRRLELTATPDNIPVRVGESKLMAKAYDSSDNVMDGILIGFRIVKGAGGGDETIVPAVDYSRKGMAEAIFKAGNTISYYQSVKLAAVALSISGNDTLIIASSDTVGLTVSGPPAKISVGTNRDKGENPLDGTYLLPTAAVVTDVNGNLVADGTPVNFSVQPVGANFLGESYSLINVYPGYAFVDSILYKLRWTDYNNNGKLDPGEEPSAYDPTRKHPYRGEDMDGDGVIRLGDPFIDYNTNGVRDTTFETTEPAVPGFQDTSGGGRREMFVDWNRNGVRDRVEPFISANGNCDANGDGICAGAGAYDRQGRLLETNHYGSPLNRPFPSQVAVGIEKTVTTKQGKALTKITYVQSLAWKVEVRATAESNGVRSHMDLLLPIIKDGDE